jgi:HAD superfamily hydrolase (TIGR01509 family)
MEAMPGAVELVRALRAGRVPIAVASSSGLADVAASLRAVGLDDDLPVRASAEEVARPKPAADVYLLAVRRLGLAPEACVALEDAGPGVAAAVAAGLACVAVPNAYTVGHDFAGAALVARSLRDLSPGSLRSLVRRAPPTGR